MAIQSIIAAGNKTPGIYTKVTLGAGTQSSGAAGKRILLFGNGLAAGNAVASVPVPIGSPGDAVTAFGAGSELHGMCVEALKRFKFIQLWAVLVAETGTKATAAAVFTGTATASGTFDVWVGTTRYTHVVAIGDTHTETGAAIAALINGDTDAPATAIATAGSVAVTAKQDGVRGNQIRLKSTGSATGISHTLVDGYLAGATGQDDCQAALDAVAGTRYHYLVCPSSVEAELLKFRTAVRSGAEPANANRARFFGASLESYATTVAIAVAINAGRGQYIWHYNSFEPASILAAVAAAEFAEAYEKSAAFNTAGLPMVGILPQSTDSDKPTATEINNALNNGMTVLQEVAGEMRVAMSVTMQSLDDASNPDYRVIHTHYVEVSDAVADDIESNFESEFGESLLVPDIAGQMPEPGEVSPLTGKDFIVNRLGVYGPGGAGNRLLASVDPDVILTEIDGSVGSKMNGVIPIIPVELFLQGAFDIRQIN